MTHDTDAPGDPPPSAWPRPLAGVRRVDLSLLLPGPYCTLLLAQGGATAVKVEPPGGDPVRQLNLGGFAVANRGKQSGVVDGPESEAGALLARLVDDADVVAAAGFFEQSLDLDDATLQRPCRRIADCMTGALAAFTIASGGLRSAADEPVPALGEHAATWAEALGVPHPESR